jgi:glycoside/pentoside/hexuronide:cation symporter, GPH family
VHTSATDWRRLKLAYALGRAAEGIKSRAFEFFLFFYFVQVLGLSGSLAGLAVGIALICDSVSDPLVGSYSDHLHSRYGRRHPLMLASILPLCVSFYLLFVPPDGLGEMGLFLWLLVFSVLARTSISLFHVPHLALGAELTDHYTERSSIVALRTVFGALGSVFALLSGLNFFMAPTAQYSMGQLNPAAYSPFALTMSISMGVVILLSSYGTRGVIPVLRTADRAQIRGLSPAGLLMRTWSEMTGALKNRSFRALFLGLLLVAIVAGVHGALTLYMTTYYWEMPQDKTSAYILAGGIGFFAGLMLLRRFHERFDKKPVFAMGMAMLALLSAAGPGLRELGLFPGNTHPALFPTLLGLVALAAFFGGLAAVSGGSMMADIADEHELNTGRRQEGVFFSAASFAGKAAGGVGHVVAGVLIDLIGFPANAEAGSVAAETLTRLGLFNGPVMAVVMGFGVIYFLRYDLTRTRHAEILHMLRERNGVKAEPG